MPGGDEEQSWTRAVAQGLTALVVAALVVGVVVGVVSAGAANVLGLGHTSTSSTTPAGLVLPKYSPTPSAPATAAPYTPNVSFVPLDPSTGPSEKVGQITLYATPQSVTPGQRIDFSGTYLDGEGVALQVQRRDGEAWVDFPTRATVRQGAFTTYIYTGRIGPNVFRVYDPTTGRSSPPVTVTIG